jgi:hypothetical protein
MIFKAGQHPSAQEVAENDGAEFLTEDAKNVCKLLAIDPNDILVRDISHFEEPGLTKQRLQLRYEYYEEKRVLKLKAIENVLIKCQAGRNGQFSPEALQIMGLLDDLK